MNRQDHLLTIVAEECSEIQKLCCKALRFGLEDINPDEHEANSTAIIREFNDLVAVMEMLFNNYIDELLDDELIINKTDKVDRWLDYSKMKGRLD